VSKIYCAYKDSGTLSPNRKEKLGRKRKTTPHTDQLLLRNSRLHPTLRSKDFQRDLLSLGIGIDVSSVRSRLPAVGRKARKPIKSNC
jgi:hypothetical protein